MHVYVYVYAHVLTQGAHTQGMGLLWKRERDLLLVESLQERLKAHETGRKAAK